MPLLFVFWCSAISPCLVSSLSLTLPLSSFLVEVNHPRRLPLLFFVHGKKKQERRDCEKLSFSPHWITRGVGEGKKYERSKVAGLGGWGGRGSGWGHGVQFLPSALPYRRVNTGVHLRGDRSQISRIQSPRRGEALTCSASCKLTTVLTRRHSARRAGGG